jgi:hypothetical protein
MTEDIAYNVISFVIARSATFLKAAETRLLVAAQVSFQKHAVCGRAFGDPFYQGRLHQFLGEQTLAVVVRLKQIVPEYLMRETNELDDSILDNAYTIFNEYIPIIDRRLHDTRCQRLERAEGILKEFRLHLFALHAAAKPKGRKPRNPVYANTIESVTGRLPVPPMRATILTKLKFLLPERFISENGEPTDELRQFKRISRTIQMLMRQSHLPNQQITTTRAVRRRTAIEYAR